MHAGSRQGTAKRAAAFEERFFAPDNCSSKLTELLITSWIWGHISASLVQKIAFAASADLNAAGKGKINEWVILSQLGNNGRHANNTKRDLERKLPRVSFTTTEVRMPLKVSQRKEIVDIRDRPVPLLLPETSFSMLWHSSAWSHMVLGNPDELPSFWRAVAGHPAVREHPVLKITGFQHRAIPLVLHGDGAAVTQNIGSASKSCLFVSWRSLLCKSASSKEKHVLMCALWSHVASKGTFITSRCVWRAICQSFRKLFEDQGKCTGGFFPVVLFSTGDLEYYNQWHELPRWTCAQPCALCNIRLGDIGTSLHLGELAPDAWDVPRESKCPLFHEMLSPSGVCPDLMHSKHLGVDQRYLGSVAWLLVQKLIPGNSLEERVGRLLKEMLAPWFFLNTVKSLF